MLLLSTLQRFVIVDRHQTKTRLNDLAIASMASDYPPVTQLFYTLSKQDYVLPWSEVSEIDRHKREITVADLNKGKKASRESTTRDILLLRDVQDALVLDLQNRRATRANDLLFEEKEGQLTLRAADVSFWALLRRLTKGLIGRDKSNALYDWKYVEFLRGDPQAVSHGAGYQLRITRLSAGAIAQLASSVPYLHAAELLTLLPDSLAKETLEIMPPQRQLQVFEELSEEQALKLLTLMSPDVAADIIGQLKPDEARRFLNKLPSQSGERILELLQYPEDTVGGIMTNDPLTMPADVTVREARERLRAPLKESDFVYFIYAVDNESARRLQGVISLRDLLTEEDTALIRDIMNPYTDTLNPYDSATKAAHTVIDSSLAALPVVGEQGQLVGLVTIDAAINQAAPGWGAQTPKIFT